MTLILASASPRRQELLLQIGVSFEVQPADIDETSLAGESPEAYVERLALEKARHIAAKRPGSVVLAADTTVVHNEASGEYVESRILGKPADREEALAMIRMLSGSGHLVQTGIALVDGPGEKVFSQVVTTRVRFRTLALSEIEAYCDTGEGADKAGGYGIQGKGAVLIDGIEGSYSNVVGLPLAETALLLRQANIPIWQ
ncbi:MAG: septum formation protein Maf [Oceanospirillaceae bacterium]|nr:septum formation protein Maf [Oceanospirillaceae bacterium]